MFNAIYRKKSNVDGRWEKLYTLFAKSPEEVAGDDLEAIKKALEEDNTAVPAGKDYREASTALSLLLFMGREKFPAALSAVFPDRGDTAAAILALQDFSANGVGLRLEKGEEADFYNRAKAVGESLEPWPLMEQMVRRYAVNVLLRVHDFNSVRDMLRELCGGMITLDTEGSTHVAELCNEFFEV